MLWSVYSEHRYPHPSAPSLPECLVGRWHDECTWCHRRHRVRHSGSHRSADQSEHQQSADMGSLILDSSPVTASSILLRLLSHLWVFVLVLES